MATADKPTQAVEFVLKGTLNGKPVSIKEGMPITRLVEFSNEVMKFIQGGDSRAELYDVRVQVEESSYLLRALIPIGVLGSFFHDSEKIAKAHNLGAVDPKRAEIFERWIERAQIEKTITYTVRSPSGLFPEVKVDEKSKFSRVETGQWIDVERYLIGTITDWGGAQAVNVHVRVADSKTEIIVDAKENQILAQRDNLVYRKAIVHVRAKQHSGTGQLDHYKLVDLRAYNPSVNEKQLQELFAKGAKAWADVPKAGTWVEELRGGNDV